jgi:hypothetical protein
MRRVVAFAIAGAGAVALLACHVISEELPSRPTQVAGVPGPGTIPVVVVPIPTQAPDPRNVPSPSSPLAPSPNPNPRPTATPVPGGDGRGGGGGGGEPPTTNRSPVARLNASVYFVECNGAPVPGTSRADTAPVGCRLHLDCTARDGSNSPTIPRGNPQWTYSNPGLVSGGSSGFNPVLTIRAAGHLDIYAEVDGFRSATFGVDFQ